MASVMQMSLQKLGAWRCSAAVQVSSAMLTAGSSQRESQRSPAPCHWNGAPEKTACAGGPRCSRSGGVGMEWEASRAPHSANSCEPQEMQQTM
eukprot:365387-Chlamydomonas_euryale.AAC.10